MPGSTETLQVLRPTIFLAQTEKIDRLKAVEDMVTVGVVALAHERRSAANRTAYISLGGGILGL